MTECIPEPNSGCWLWLGYCDKNGYGGFGYNWKMRIAHRFSYEAFCGPITNGLHVLHKCDTPSCVNPDHLFLGTELDNARDKHAKGRQRYFRGTERPDAILTEQQVLEIRNSKVRPQTALAEKYGISQTLVSKIQRRERWKHLTDKEIVNEN